MTIWEALSVVVPIAVIVFAVLSRKVVASLLIGVVLCGLAIGLRSPSEFISNWTDWSGVKYLVSAVLDQDHLVVIAFSLLISATVHLLQKAGDMYALVLRFKRFATTRKTAQLMTICSGLFIFFDDYANTLVVGNSMRSVTDRLKVSREKLAYLVDATSAPLAAIAFITTWIGAEVGYIEDALTSINVSIPAYQLFLDSLAYAFYPILTLLFVVMVAWSGRDFGTMLVAEKKAASDPKLVDNEACHKIGTAWRAWVTIALLVGMTIAGLIVTSSYALSTATFMQVIGDGNSYLALLWASGVAFLFVVIAQFIMSEKAMVANTWSGIKNLFPAVLVLVGAWSFAGALVDLGTSDTIVGWMSNSSSPYVLPTLSFIISAVVAFTTGSSWATMAIMYGIVIPAAWELSGHDPSAPLLANAVSTVLAGAVFGDHCSPISDTTILSAMASKCDQVSHVKTQMPYALLVGVVSVLGGTLTTSFGLSVWVAYIGCAGVLLTVLLLLGEKVVE